MCSWEIEQGTELGLLLVGYGGKMNARDCTGMLGLVSLLWASCGWRVLCCCPGLLARCLWCCLCSWADCVVVSFVLWASGVLLSLFVGK